jgi:hypothetical protein
VSRLFRFACPEKVEAMEPRAGGHHCATCRKVVLDLGRLTPAEAARTLREAPAGTCVSYDVAPDGKLLFRGPRRGAGPVVLGVAAFLAACANAPSSTSSDPADLGVSAEHTGSARFNSPHPEDDAGGDPPDSSIRALAGEPVAVPPAPSEPSPAPAPTSTPALEEPAAKPLPHVRLAGKPAPPQRLAGEMAPVAPPESSK